MSLINDTHQFVFLHVAKTGGRSINRLLKTTLGKEGSFNTKKLNPEIDQLGRLLAVEARDLAGAERWQRYFTFAYGRHPLDRAVSIFENMHTDYQATLAQPPHKPSDKVRMLVEITSRLGIAPGDLSFDAFVIEVLRDRVFENYHWDSQSNALTDEQGTVMFDFVGRFERLQADFDTACGQIGLSQMALPHFNKSNRKHWTSYYTPQTKRIATQTYACDFDLLGYDPDHAPD